MPDKYIAQGDFTFSSGVKAAETLLAKPQPPTAIFAANDEMAAGYKAPDDESIVGFDNFHIAETVWLQLTTVNTPTFEVGKLAATILLGSPDELEEVAVSAPSLVIRASSAPLN